MRSARSNRIGLLISTLFGTCPIADFRQPSVYYPFSDCTLSGLRPLPGGAVRDSAALPVKLRTSPQTEQSHPVNADVRGWRFSPNCSTWLTSTKIPGIAVERKRELTRQFGLLGAELPLLRRGELQLLSASGRGAWRLG